jgi:hypothetical protein
MRRSVLGITLRRGHGAIPLEARWRNITQISQPSCSCATSMANLWDHPVRRLRFPAWCAVILGALA